MDPRSSKHGCKVYAYEHRGTCARNTYQVLYDTTCTASTVNGENCTGTISPMSHLSSWLIVLDLAHRSHNSTAKPKSTMLKFKNPTRTNNRTMLSFLLLALLASTVRAFIPLLDGGSKMPVLYKSWFDDQMAKQASAAIAKAVGAGKVRVLAASMAEIRSDGDFPMLLTLLSACLST
jgi:hypothetical protein